MTAYELRISDWSSDVCSSDLMATPCRSRWPTVPTPSAAASAPTTPSRPPTAPCTPTSTALRKGDDSRLRDNVLRDNVGQERVFQLQDLVLQRQLALLQALSLKLVEGPGFHPVADDFFEVVERGNATW